MTGHWVSNYHDMLMQRHSGRSMNMTAEVESLSRILGNLMGELPRWLWLFIIGGGWELISYASERRRIADYQRKRDIHALRRDKADADLRLAVLQAQIEPHFLFNTLASVRSLIRTEPARAIDTINALSEYLRSTLPKLRKDVGVQSATLGEQATICVRYLDLMNIRMAGRITVTTDIPDNLKTMAFPPLLLISLVENAVKHGVEPKAGPAAILLRARLTGSAPHQNLQVDIEDDGVGLSEGAGSGVGLANVREQLQHRFGDNASLSVETLPAGGVRARIELPASAS
ncbi:MAG: sensor histidine kinase [Burkholderiales bacterium]|nr:MAG: sensor histidine kinase [Burkholderiales bacterium]